MDIDKDFRASTAAIATIWRWFGGDIRQKYDDAVNQLVKDMKPWRLPANLEQDVLKAKKIICLSDLHIGAGPCEGGRWNARDNFTAEKTEAFKQFLEQVNSSSDKIVFYLGDVIEAWQADGSRVIKNRLSLFNQMSEGKRVYLVGNHDRWYSHGVGCREAVPTHPFFDDMTRLFVLKAGNKKILFMHGHEIDPYNMGEEPSKGQAIAILAAGVEDTIGGTRIGNDSVSAEERLQSIAERAMGAFNRCFGWIPRIITYVKRETGHQVETSHEGGNLHNYHLQNAAYLKEKLKGTANEFDFVVMGHTHIPGQRAWYHNTGSWSEGVPTFIEIDISGAEPVFNHYEWRDGKAHLIEEASSKI